MSGHRRTWTTSASVKYSRNFSENPVLKKSDRFADLFARMLARKQNFYPQRQQTPSTSGFVMSKVAYIGKSNND